MIKIGMSNDFCPANLDSLHAWRHTPGRGILECRTCGGWAWIGPGDKTVPVYTDDRREAILAGDITPHERRNMVSRAQDCLIVDDPGYNPMLGAQEWFDHTLLLRTPVYKHPIDITSHGDDAQQYGIPSKPVPPVKLEQSLGGFIRSLACAIGAGAASLLAKHPNPMVSTVAITSACLFAYLLGRMDHE